MSRLRSILSSLGALGMVGVIALGATPARADNLVDITLNGGTRTATIANLTLSAVNYSHSQQQQTGTMVLTADDSTGAGTGWNVTVLSSAFAYSGAAPDGTAIPAANFAVGTPAAPAMTAGLAVGAAGPFAGTGGALDAARKVIYADASGGLGTYTQDLPVTLTIPAQARAGAYSGTLTVTIAEGPGA